MNEAVDLSGAPALHLVLIGERTQREEISAALGRMKEFRLYVREAEFGERAAASTEGIDAILAVVHKGRGFPPSALEAKTAESGRPLRVALLHDRSALAIREALAAGADEVLFLPLDPGDTARVLYKLGATHTPEEGLAGGKIWSVSSVTSGVGVTTVAANIALALAYWGKKKAALLDLDYESSDLAAALNLEPEHTLFDLLNPVGRLNSPQVEAALSKHGSGVYLLAGPKHLEESEQIGAARVAAVLELLQQMVDYVVVDVGRHFNDTAVTVWEHSDELLYVIDQSVRAMRGAWRFLDLFARLKVTELQPRFVVNRYSSRHMLTEQHISHTLGRPAFARIPVEGGVMEQVLGRGQDLWKVAPRSKLTASFVSLARELSGPQLSPKRRGLLAGLFSRNDKLARS